MTDKVMTRSETIQRLEDLEKQTKDLVKEIDDIRDILTNWELTLGDLSANEEQLKDRTSELIDLMSELVSCRMWLDFLNLEEENRAF